MANETIEEQRERDYQFHLDIAEKIAPTWEKQRARVEEYSTPVRHGYMRMPDPAAAFAETRRVLRPAGRVALAVWGAMEHNPWIAIAGISLGQRGHIPPPPPPPAPGPFSMASAERVEGLLREAGFTEVQIEEAHGRFAIAGADDYLGLIGDTAGPVGLARQGLGDHDRAAVRGDVEDALRRFAVDRGGYELPCVALCAVAS